MSNEDAEVRWHQKPWMIIFLLFFVLGPFGLPILYKSPRFGRAAKILITIVMIPYTWYLCVITVKHLREASQKIAALREQMK